MNTVECQVCGNTVDLRDVNPDERRTRLYCSRSCAAIGSNMLRNKITSRIASIPSTLVGDVYTQCLLCQTHTSTEYNSLFCASVCRQKFWEEYEQIRKTKPPRNNEQRKTKKCPRCDTMICPSSKTCRIHRDYGNTGRVSTQLLYTNVVAKWISGEHPGNHGPKTPCVVHPAIRGFLYEEADNSCTKCGFKAVHPSDGRPILNLNHIDGDASNHSRDNLEVLCPNCHAMTPNYGRRNKASSRTKK